ncbi:MAG TPA: hypothetical protein DEA22_11450, partial [Blastocatellia bacterium]|nr:hypothetical protein [Blastocatellia bacterium]
MQSVCKSNCEIFRRRSQNLVRLAQFQADHPALSPEQAKCNETFHASVWYKIDKSSYGFYSNFSGEIKMIRRKFFGALLVYAIVLAALPVAALAQSSAGARAAVYAAPKEVIDKIKDEGMNRSQVMQTLSYLTDVIGGRLTNSPNMKHANEWTRDTMAKWGMQNAKLEAWGPFGRGWELKRFSAQVSAPYSFPVIAYPKAWS